MTQIDADPDRTNHLRDLRAVSLTYPSPRSSVNGMTCHLAASIIEHRVSRIWFGQGEGFSRDRFPVTDSMSMRHTRVVAVAASSMSHLRPE
jgi:hypothetical protein